MAYKKIKNATDQRPFIIIYHDFLDSDLLKTTHEVMLYIALKKFADNKNQCFPSLGKLSKITRMSKRKVQDTLKELEKKHVIGIENRSRADGGNTSNIYTLYDYQELWNTKNGEEAAKIIDEAEEKRMIEILSLKGYTITKAKEPVFAPAKETKTDPQVSKIPHNSTLLQGICQDLVTEEESPEPRERYTLDQVHKIFGYKAMIHDHPLQKNDIDFVMRILHTTLTITNPTIRIAGADRPIESVIAKLMKLTPESIMYIIGKYQEQKGSISKEIPYMRTILYTAPEQYELYIQNQYAQHNN